MNEEGAILIECAFTEIHKESVKIKIVHVLHNNELCEFEFRKYKGEIDLTIRGQNWAVFIENPTLSYSVRNECLNVNINKDTVIKFEVY